MELAGTTAVILGSGGFLAETLEGRLRGLGAAVSAEGPAQLLFHIAAQVQAAQGAPEQPAEILARALRTAKTLRHICLIRESEAESLALPIEAGLRTLAEQTGIPVALLRAPSKHPRYVGLPTAAVLTAILGLAGEYDLGAKS